MTGESVVPPAGIGASDGCHRLGTPL